LARCFPFSNGHPEVLRLPPQLYLLALLPLCVARKMLEVQRLLFLWAAAHVQLTVVEAVYDTTGKSY